jgi:hypothetical protein
MQEVIDELTQKEMNERFMMNVKREVRTESERYDSQKNRIDRLLEDGLRKTVNALSNGGSRPGSKKGSFRISRPSFGSSMKSRSSHQK